MTPPLFAVDTNFLMDLAEAFDAPRDALEVIRRRSPRASVLVTDSVLHELLHFAESPSFGKQVSARKALAFMSDCDIQPALITDLQASIADSIADKLRDQGILPRAERHDARILAEAAVLGCQVLISSDSHLRNADRTLLALALQACDVPVVVVCSPDEIVRKFAGR